MYDIQTTPGLIIDWRPYGEAGKIVHIFTRDLGLVKAVAQGIRLEKSKLRYQTQNYSFGIFSLVKGKEYWRLVGAQELKVEFSASPETRKASLSIIAPVSLILKRLLQGEQAHSELFECLGSCADFIQMSQQLNDEQLKTLESVTVLRILHRLGYVSDALDSEGELKSNEFSLKLLEKLNTKRIEMIKHINKALKESHL
ncbi:MAG: DNA repair protein RecO [Candidatus Taylorbacteria bacterium]|nr:DNA repair protein RecO [Candidatus Taylorbacteria bacterium]